MRKTITITYPASPDRVAAMLADPAYQQLRLERVRLTDAAVDVATRGQGFVTTITGAIPPSLLPSAAQRFIRSSVSFTLTESWGEPAETVHAPAASTSRSRAPRCAPVPPVHWHPRVRRPPP